MSRMIVSICRYGFFSVTAHYAVIFTLLGGGEGERQVARTSLFAYPSRLLPTPLSPGILVIHFNHLLRRLLLVFVPVAFSLAALTHIFCQLKQQHVMTHDITTVKRFPILPEVSFSCLAQGRFFICFLA